VAHPCATYEKHNPSVLGWYIPVPHAENTRRNARSGMLARRLRVRSSAPLYHLIP